MAVSSRARTVLRLAAAGLTAGLIGVAALAAPQMTAGDAISPNGPYALTCWQEGQRIAHQSDAPTLSTLEIGLTPSATLTHTDGSRRALLALGESLCIVDYGPG